MSNPDLALQFNDRCHCVTTHTDTLNNLLFAALGGERLELPEHMIAAEPYFLWQGHVQTMASIIEAVEAVIRNPAYEAWAVERAPAVARADRKSIGVFTSYDFHLADGCPRLIEVNTNAGGALLALQAAKAQIVDPAVCGAPALPALEDVEPAWAAMFLNEWRRERGSAPLRTIAIVDDTPHTQHLFVEFRLAKALFEAHGYRAVICAPEALEHTGAALKFGEQRIDLVYNRLTDFYLSEPAHSTLREAYLTDSAVITPAPRHHALRANKHALAFWSSPDQLQHIGVDEHSVKLLGKHIPHTESLTENNAQALWQSRKSLFFKPATGFASRGTYDGAKISRSRFSMLLNADYVAQQRVAPPTRAVQGIDAPDQLKADIRCITYGSTLQHVFARLYRGQTTNLRTPGGGLAAVVPV
jgi:hypothetical protein